MIYTAQYSYNGADRVDVTVKSAKGTWKLFAPTWAMVKQYKKTGDTEQYTAQYVEILKSVLANHLVKVKPLAEYFLPNDCTFVCFCQPGDFCHRVLLAEWFQEQFNIPYMGEKEYNAASYNVRM